MKNNLFGRGNTKLGNQILTWSLPAGRSCPGLTDACASICYASTGFFVAKNVAASHQANFEFSRSSDFVSEAVAELNKSKLSVVRIHVAGDFYDEDYTLKWYEIIKACPTKRFFVYTRSWRIPAIFSILKGLAKLPNLRMWFSVDKDTGKPSSIPTGVRLAYMQMVVGDVPRYKVQLFLRDQTKTIVKKINGGLVCPRENGINKTMTCYQCGYCWRK